MTAKRFTIDNDMNFNNKVETYELNCIRDNENQTFYFIADSIENVQLFVKRLNELNEENEQLKFQLQNTSDQRDEFHRGARENANRVGKLEKENEQLKQDNNALIHLLENQSIIIQELHSKLLEYQLKEPIVLTKEDLELMGKALSYYTHRKCGE